MTTKLKVLGMTCDHCKRSVTEALMALGGVSAVAVDLATKEVAVDHAEGAPDLAGMRAAVEAIGFEVG